MRKKLALVLTIVIAMLVLPATAAFATHVAPVFVSGNATCAQLLDNPDAQEIKIEPVVSGTYGPVTITVNSTSAGQTFDWTSTIGMDAVFAKGGPNGNLYLYSPPATSDTGLHAPVNTSNGRYYGLSHISFCFVPRPSTILTLSGATSPITVITGDNVTLTFAEFNDGTEVLDNPSVTTDHAGCATPGLTGGDTNLNGDLDPGETFTFSCTLTNVTADVTIVAIGHGFFEGDDVTWCAPGTNPANTICDPEERTVVVVDVVNPNTSLSLSGTSNPTVVIPGGDAVLSFAETNTGDVPLQTPSVETDNAGCTPTKVSESGTVNNILDVGETWIFSCTVTNVQNDVTVVATGHGFYAGNDVTWCAPGTSPANTICRNSERTSVDIDVQQPSTILSLSGATSPIAVSQGGSVVITFAEENDGETALTSPSVTTDHPECATATKVSESGTVNNILDVGETWTFSCTLTNIQTSTTVTAIGHGTAFGVDVTWCAEGTSPANTFCDADEIEVVQINVVSEGCTPGFWRNHTNLWDGGGDDVTPYKTTDLFNSVFGVTAAQSGQSNSTTLGTTINLGGGGLNALARHATAALLNASSGGAVDYEFTEAQVISIYQDAVGAIAGPETVSSALAKFSGANEAGCPLN